MRIAVTGGIAEGKSTVLSFLAEKGLKTTSADEIARTILAEPEHQNAVARLFSLDIPLDRTALFQIITADVGARRALNAYMHPIIDQRMRKDNAAAFEVPLLVETCSFHQFDEIWVVYCGPELQLQRLATRLGDESRAQAALESQLPTRAKVPFADVIIRTNGDLASVKARVEDSLKNRRLG